MCQLFTNLNYTAIYSRDSRLYPSAWKINHYKSEPHLYPNFFKITDLDDFTEYYKNTTHCGKMHNLMGKYGIIGLLHFVYHSDINGYWTPGQALDISLLIGKIAFILKRINYPEYYFEDDKIYFQ